MGLKNLRKIININNKPYRPINLTCYFEKSLKKQCLKNELAQFYQSGFANENNYLLELISQIKNLKFEQAKQGFITTLLPDRPPLQLIIFYLETLYSEIGSSNLLVSMKYANRYSLYFIAINLHKIYHEKLQEQVGQTEQMQNYYNHLARSTLISFLQYYKKYPMTTEFDCRFHLKILKISSYLKVYNPYLLEYFKNVVQIQLHKFSIIDLFKILVFLAQDRSLPYEFFYKKKMDWINQIESSEKFSKMRISCSINYLKIFSKERLINCERIITKLLQIIAESEVVMEDFQLVQTLYIYSRIKYGVDTNFVTSLIKRISQTVNLKQLSQISFTLLVKALGNLNYQSHTMVQKLKIINYDLFVASLQIGSENIGEYYQRILKEIDFSISQSSNHQEPLFHQKQSAESISDFNKVVQI